MTGNNLAYCFLKLSIDLVDFISMGRSLKSSSYSIAVRKQLREDRFVMRVTREIAAELTTRACIARSVRVVRASVSRLCRSRQSPGN